MRTLLLTAILGAGIAVAAQQQMVFTDPSKNIEVRGGSGKFSWGQGSTYQFDLRSGVHAIVRDQGLELFAQRVQGTTMKEGNKGGLKSATASGGVRVIKTAAGSRTELTGSLAKYLRTGDSANLDLSGPVKITNYTAAKRQSLVATGSSAVATLLARSTGSDPLRTATLRGPVAIDATSRVSSGGVENVHATGSRLDIDNAGKPAKLILSGGVEIHGKQFGDARGLSKVTMVLNERREVVSIETQAGGRP